MRLIIAEKPSVARGIADVLGHASKKDGCIECGNTTLTWCAGHLLEQFSPEDYNGGNFIRRENLPVVPEIWKLQPRDERAQKQIKVIKNLLKQATEVVNAGDADREGQLLVDEVLLYLNWKGKTTRLWLSSLDEESVKRALASLKPNESLRGLYDSALARQRADWLLGLNGSIAIRQNLNAMGQSGSWSVGRVQTPTLALLTDRHAVIHGHKKQDHYKVQIGLKDGVTAHWQIPEDLLTDGLLLDKQHAENAAQEVEGEMGKVTQYQKRKGSRAAPLPFSLAALQMEANSRLGFSAKQTLETAQSLYEAKLTTYPRSDCRYLPEEMHGEAESILQKIGSLSEKGGNSINASRKHPAWNNGEVTAHHAIIPTGKQPENLDERAKKLYELVRESYLRLFMPDEQFEQQQAIFQFKNNENLIFKASAKKIIEPGWTALGEETRDENENTGEESAKALPDYTEGQQIECEKASVQALQTRPPKPYNDKTLIAAMTGIHRLITDPKLKARLKETSGLGTEATRASIIERLIAQTYAERKGKAIEPTERGIKLITMLRKGYPQLADPGETAIQEDALADIAARKLNFDSFIETAIQKTKEEVQALLSSNLTEGEITMLKCPKCENEALVKHKAKTGLEFWKCRECQTAFGDENDAPGKEWVKREDDGKPREEGPACPKCRQKTTQFLTKTEKPYYRCGKCNRNWWPDWDDKAKLGKEWEIRK